MHLVDTHAHLNDSAYASDLDDVVARANSEGIDRIIVCGYDVPSSRSAVELADRYPCVYATVGVHPHDSRLYDSAAAEVLTELSRHPKVLAIGEIGLDYHYDLSPRPAQREAFEAQIDLAAELGLPIVAHSRDSNEDVLQVLEERAANTAGCVLHCYSGDRYLAERVIEDGFYIGVDGPITYKSAAGVRDVVEFCPLDRLLIETDCPYLTPVPHRGKRNEPAYVRYVAQAVAAVKQIDLEEVAVATSTNAGRLFAGLFG